MGRRFRERVGRALRCALVALAGVVMAGAAAAQQGTYERFAPRPVGEVVPPAWIEGPHHRIQPTVQTIGYLDNFIVASDYGTFEAPSDAMLRRLLREIRAIAALHEVTLSKAYAEALKGAAMGPVRGVKALATEPVETVKAVPKALFSVFSRVGESVSTATSGGKTKYEDTGMAQALQMSAYKRDYAKELDVDPYSSNPVLQKQLDSVAWAAAVGNLTVGVASMASGSEVATALSAARNIDQARAIVAAEPPAELMKRNRAMLDQMGIDRRLRDQFLKQTQYSPRAKTVLVMALAAMPATAGKASVLAAAVAAPDEVTAIFYQQMAELLDGYDDRVARLTRLERFNRLVVARDAKGKTILLIPIDHVIWDERAAAAATGLARRLKPRPGGGDVQFWITGTASPRFKSEAERLGIAVHEQVGRQLPLLD